MRVQGKTFGNTKSPTVQTQGRGELHTGPAIRAFRRGLYSAPGEQAIDSQVFPLKPAPLGKMSFSKDEIARVTPEHQKFCEDLLKYGSGMHYDGPFTRYGMKPSIVFRAR
jgi:hypothetical protein